LNGYGKLFLFSQEVLFYEDGEPIIDGESGDLRVSSSVFIFVSNCLVCMLLRVQFADNPYANMNSFVSVPHLMNFSEGKAMTYIPLSL
jgi:hypothetical protein